MDPSGDVHSGYSVLAKGPCQHDVQVDGFWREIDECTAHS